MRLFRSRYRLLAAGFYFACILSRPGDFAKLGRGGDAIVAAKAGGIDILLGALNGEGIFPDFLPYRLFQSLEAEQTVQFEDGARAQPNYIRSIIPFVYFAKHGAFKLVGTNNRFMYRPNPEDSIHLQAGRWASGLNEVVLGSQVAEELWRKEKLRQGNQMVVVPWAGRTGASGGPLSVRIVGVFEPTDSTWDREIYASVPTAQAALAKLDLTKISIWGSQVLHYFLLYLEPNGFNALEALINRRTVGQVVLVREQKARLEELTGTGRTLGLFVTILTLILGALSVSSMLITRFDAMSLQLAVLRALGYRKRTIGSWLLWEGVLLGITACLIGAALDAAFFPIMRDLLGEALPSPDIVSSSLWQSFPIWITALTATVASIVVPLYRVYRQDVHFSLRD